MDAIVEQNEGDENQPEQTGGPAGEQQQQQAKPERAKTVAPDFADGDAAGGNGAIRAALAVEIDVKLPGSSARNDSDIARTAQNVLANMSQLPHDAVKVKVEGGWITLSGELDWQFQRQSAGAAVRYLMGTTGVSDQIVMKPHVGAGVVKADIDAALRRGARSGTHKISVDVSGGDVTLSGTVGSWAERESARRAAWGTPGVRLVVDNIRVAL